MKIGFTLLELIVVIIIIGVLATLGFTQYGRMVERARGAEAKAILGDIRKLAAAHYLQFGSLQDATNPMTNERLNLGAGDDEIPTACRGSHYFSYAAQANDATTVEITATRCGGAGKAPGGGNSEGDTIVLTSNLSNGTDTWSGTGPW